MVLKILIPIYLLLPEWLKCNYLNIVRLEFSLFKKKNEKLFLQIL